MPADGTAAAPATPAQTAPPPQGGSILTTAIPAAPPPPAPGSAEAAVQGVVDGPPEWAPQKYWDANAKQVKVEDLGRGYKSLEQLLGREKVPVPANDDDQEGWQRWYNAAGRPEAPDKYEFARPDKLPDGVDYDEDLESTYRQASHMAGLNKKQAGMFYDLFVKHQIDRHVGWQKMQAEGRAKIEGDLMREHGPQYQGFVGQAKSAMSKYTDPDFNAWLEQTGLGNDPRMIRVFGRIGKDMGGTTRLKGAMPPDMAPADIDKAIRDHRAKHEKALWDSAHPDHQTAVGELQRLYAMKPNADQLVQFSAI